MRLKTSQSVENGLKAASRIRRTIKVVERTKPLPIEFRDFLDSLKYELDSVEGLIKSHKDDLSLKKILGRRLKGGTTIDNTCYNCGAEMTGIERGAKLKCTQCGLVHSADEEEYY